MFDELAVVIILLILAWAIITAPRGPEKFRGRSMYTGVSQDARVFDYSDRYPNTPIIS